MHGVPQRLAVHEKGKGVVTCFLMSYSIFLLFKCIFHVLQVMFPITLNVLDLVVVFVRFAICDLRFAIDCSFIQEYDTKIFNIPLL